MNVLIIKIGALGDVVRTSFIAQALKNKYKKENLNIIWITGKKAIPLFINNPYVDIAFSEDNKHKIKNVNFDLIINLEEDIDNAKFVSSLKYKKLIGVFLNEDNRIDYTGETKYWFDMSLISKYGKKKADLLKRKNKKTHRQIMVEIIGLKDYERYEPFLRLNRVQRNIAKTFLRRYNLLRTDLIVGVNLGSGERWPKDLPIEKTIKIINELHDKFNAHILLFGGIGEEERNRAIVKLSKAPIIATGSGNDLIEFPALVSVCNLVITSDTLGLHISLALKRKTIVLIGPTSHHEIDMYNFGEKIIAESNCLCCYKESCKSMQKIPSKKVINVVKKIINFKIAIIITAFNEPNIGKAIEAAMNQKTNYEYEIIVSAPDDKTLNIAKEFKKRDNRIKLFKDPGKGKMNTLNILFDKIKREDILILTDGDVHISENAVEEISNLFLNPEIGCVTGRPTPLEDKNTKYGYWANFLFEAAHRLRKKAFEKDNFIECSGYLWAFKGDSSIKIPLDTAEDAIIPYHFWDKGYKIGYAENAQVYVKNVNNWRDWVKQKVRTTKAHETLEKYVDTKTTPRVKSFKTEVKGFSDLLRYSENIREFYWSILLAFSRFYMWGVVFHNSRIKKFRSVDNWERIESAR